MVTALLARAAAPGTASVLEVVLTVGSFVLFMLLVVVVQLRTFARRRRGEEAGQYDAEGAEVMLGPWWT